MSNNEDMEIDIDRGRGLQGTSYTLNIHEVRGDKGGSHGEDESEREQRKLEQERKAYQPAKQMMISNENLEVDNNRGRRLSISKGNPVWQQRETKAVLIMNERERERERERESSASSNKSEKPIKHPQN
jgi:hypothetical protein